MNDEPAARIALGAALARAKRGEVAEAARELIATLRVDPHYPDAYYHLARLYAHAGQLNAAIDVFSLAIRTLPHEFLDAATFVRYEGRSFDAVTALAFFEALAGSTPILNEYMRPSPLVGRYGPVQRPEQDTAIRTLLDAHWAEWQAGRTPPPRRADAFLERLLPRGAPWPRTLILMTQHVAANPAYVGSTYTAHTLHSLVELGAPVELHPADHLCFDAANPQYAWAGRNPKAEAIDAFERHLAVFRPEVVVMDAQFEESAGSLTRADLALAKTRYGFKLVCLIADGYPPLPNYAAHWNAVSDLTISLSDHGYLAAATGDTFAAPCQAIANSVIDRSADRPRDLGLCYIGSRRRNRDFWCAHAVAAGVESTVVLTDLRHDRALSQSDYYDLLGGARLVLNNGAVAPGLDVVTFRIFEATASGALVLNHAASPNDDFFIPYVHYVPFANVHELVCLARFLLANPTYRDRMAGEATNWLRNHYSGELFWRSLFARLRGN